MDYEVVDMNKLTEDELKEANESLELLFKINHTLPTTEEYGNLVKQLVGTIGENSTIMSPIAGAAFKHLNIGDNVYINSNALLMARGGITIEDNVMLAANVQLLSNNHDEYNRQLLTCKPILIKEGAWIGAGATILPGITIGKHAIIGASSVVTKNVEDYALVVGNPAREIKKLDKNKF